MAYELAGRLSLSLFFNGDEFPFERSNALNFVHMAASPRIGVPMLHFSLQDNLDFLSGSSKLSDAALIELVVSAQDSTVSTRYSFRLNSYKRTPSSGGYSYEFDAYLDASTYWHSSSVEAIKGTSYSVLSKIANDCGLSFVGDQTVDDQLWIPRNVPYFEWARQIAERGYVSDTGCMQLALDFNKTLLYKNLNGDHPVRASFILGEHKEGFILASDIQPSSAAGSLNHFSGYSDTLIEQDIEATDAKAHSELSVRKSSKDGSMMMSSRVKKTVSQARVAFAPIDVGNVHPEYERALYQNRRQNNLFNVGLSLVSPEYTGVNLLDKVVVALDNQDGYLKTFSGEYFVACRTIYIQGANYFEKLELVRKTINIRLEDTVG